MRRTSAAAHRVRDWAESGIPLLTGHSDGPSLVPPGAAASLARAHTDRIAAATGGRVRLDGARLLSERAAFTGFRRGGPTSAGRHARLLPTADGWAAVSCARPDDPPLLGALVGRDVGDDPWPAVTDWVRTHSGAELADRAELLGLAAGPIASVPTPAPTPLQPRPVEGLRVVDFSALWAGPLCAHILGLAGARVIKVETPHRPDGARRGNPDFYRLLHGGHESVVLDPDVPDQRRALGALVASADIVIEASRPRALAAFGLDAQRFADTGGTWISITAHGRASNRIGFGDDVAATAGLVAHDAEGAPVFVGDAIADPLTGVTAAALALSAPPDGGGQLWDVAMASVVAGTLDPYSRTTVADESTVVPPSRRDPAGTAPDSGRDTAAVLAELGVRIR
ncbi:CoA transferase [Rhodococcus sp. SGAir0479]|uniref:CoA transferase n=1 Tax=Rhodococcus sp. SGAir0479 TaxID=2567884 RepID=UPI0020C82F1B|nr:CoA transferase [Rhodococcus sp. SGAir0479]